MKKSTIMWINPCLFRILIHAPGIPPFPELDGYDASPGMLTGLAITHIEVKRLPDPYESDCISSYPDCVQHLIERQEEPYHMRTCELACVDYHLLEHCDCVDISGRYSRFFNNMFPILLTVN